MKVVVVSLWQEHRATLQSLVVCGKEHGWDLTVLTELPVIPTWARLNYQQYVPGLHLPPCDLLVWLYAGSLPACDCRWVITDQDAPTGRWRGTTPSGPWVRTEGSLCVNVLSVAEPEKFFSSLRTGHGAWPEGVWAGDVLPGRLCPVRWWSRGGFKGTSVIGIEGDV